MIKSDFKTAISISISASISALGLKNIFYGRTETTVTALMHSASQARKRA